MYTSYTNEGIKNIETMRHWMMDGWLKGDVGNVMGILNEVKGVRFTK